MAKDSNEFAKFVVACTLCVGFVGGFLFFMTRNTQEKPITPAPVPVLQMQEEETYSLDRVAGLEGCKVHRVFNQERHVALYITRCDNSVSSSIQGKYSITSDLLELNKNGKKE